MKRVILILALVMTTTLVATAVSAAETRSAEPALDPDPVLFANESPRAEVPAALAALLELRPGQAGFAGDFAAGEGESGGSGGEASGGSGKGKTYMIVGGAAFVGGLIIGNTLGNIIAAVGLGVGIYGAVIYF